jgi:DNA-binding NtrC family response regulator
MKSRSGVLFSHDIALAERLIRLSASEFDFELTLAADWIDGLATCRETGAAMFVDLRQAESGERLGRLFDELTSWNQPVRLIPISDGFIPRSFGEMVDILSTSHLLAPITSASFRDCLDGLQDESSGAEGRLLPESKVAEAEDIRFNTYTPELFPVIDRLMRVAVHDVTLLLVGETGTGKTTLARLLHRLSPRRDEPFQNVSCGALPPNLVESEFFGHVQGAFTGANRSKIGRFEAAAQGTLLLDEIDVLAPKEQAKLLRVIETGEFEPVGSTETRQSQARLIVASNVDLDTLTKADKFRSDLFYRLNVLEFRLPPLRERVLDIVPMALEFIADCCEQHGICVDRVHREFLARLKSYSWPGNIRELKNQVQRSVLFSNDGILTVDDLSPTILEASQRPSATVSNHRVPQTLADRVADSEREMLEEALRRHDYKRTLTAKSLGISRVGLYKKMRKLGMLETKAIRPTIL